jgi:hypothetical protein
VKGITAIGDSVMIDYAGALTRDLPGVNIQAAVSRQWSAGIIKVTALRAHDDLGSTVIIALGTNGPITHADFTAMMSALRGVSHVVFVTVFVDRPWQNQVNAVLRWGVAHHPNTALADWAALAASHRKWLYSDGTHLPIDGPGAVTLAALITHTVRSLK